MFPSVSCFLKQFMLPRGQARLLEPQLFVLEHRILENSRLYPLP
jgi:hypothetical protein